MNKVIEAIQNMVSVEEAAQRCPDCCVGAFCSNHDIAFWDFWKEAKRHLTNQSSGREKADYPRCGYPGHDNLGVFKRKVRR